MRTCDPGELAPPSVRGGPARAFTTDPLNLSAAVKALRRSDSAARRGEDRPLNMVAVVLLITLEWRCSGHLGLITRSTGEMENAQKKSGEGRTGTSACDRLDQGALDSVARHAGHASAAGGGEGRLDASPLR